MVSKTFSNFLCLILFISIGIGCSPTTTNKTTEIKEKEPEFFTKSGCPDLIIDKIEIVKRSKSKATISYVISNRGDAPAKLSGGTKKEADNAAFKMYFSSDDQLNRGDILVGGHYIDDSDLAEGGILPPGYMYTGEIQVSLKKKTSFTPVLVLNVDALQRITECDETNNTNSVVF